MANLMVLADSAFTVVTISQAYMKASLYKERKEAMEEALVTQINMTMKEFGLLVFLKRRRSPRTLTF